MPIAVADLNRFMDNARTRLPGAVDGFIHLEMFNTFNEFFQRTNIWTEKIPFPVLATNAAGDMVDIIPDSGTINLLLSALDGDKNQRPVSMPMPGCLMFDSPPGADGTWTAVVSKTCTDPIAKSGTYVGLPEVPDWVLKKYNNGMLDGLLARMMSQIGKPYSNAALARTHSARFNMAVSAGKTEASHNNLYRGQRWRFPQFASGHQRSRGF